MALHMSHNTAYRQRHQAQIPLLHYHHNLCDELQVRKGVREDVKPLVECDHHVLQGLHASALEDIVANAAQVIDVAEVWDGDQVAYGVLGCVQVAIEIDNRASSII